MAANQDGAHVSSRVDLAGGVARRVTLGVTRSRRCLSQIPPNLDGASSMFDVGLLFAFWTCPH